MDRKSSLGMVLRCLAVVLVVGVTQLLLLQGRAHAFPVFCMDIVKAPAQVLTGCRTEAEPSPGKGAPPRPVGGSDRNAGSVEALLIPKPTNKHLFQVGRRGLANTIQNHGETATSSGGATKSGRISADGEANTAAGTLMDTVTYDDRWYYMTIDKDGTYLFVGDVFDAEDPITDTGGDSYLPDGVGIGKKWTF